MNYFKVQAVLYLFLLLLSINLNAQDNINSTGGNINSNDGSVSFSIGQLFYSVNSSSDGSVIEGVQQPYEISVVSGVNDLKNIDLSLVVYPNPASDELKVKIKDYKNEILSYQLLDLNGKIVLSSKIEGDETHIQVTTLVSSTYILKIINNKGEVKTFKVVKN